MTRRDSSTPSRQQAALAWSFEGTGRTLKRLFGPPGDSYSRSKAVVGRPAMRKPPRSSPCAIEPTLRGSILRPKASEHAYEHWTVDPANGLRHIP